MKSKILAYAAVFFLLVLLFNQISQFFEKVELKSLDYKKGEIDNFVLTGINNDRYMLKGKKLIDTAGGYIIQDFNLEYFKDGERLFIYSDKGVYRKDKDILDLEQNVKIVTHDLTMETQFLRMLVKERRAFNSNPVILYTEYMKTEGDNIFIDLVRERLKLENVTTIYRGK
ncbi:LPS export ABC transporter periplasmic protein LptC [Persephonella sp.]